MIRDEFTVLALCQQNRASFCSVGCMIAYMVAPDHVEALDEEIVGVWVAEYGSSDQIDGENAYYVLETDPDRENEPMKLNPRPFVDRSDALEYVAESPHLSDVDIIGFDEFDLEVGRIYRSSRLPRP